MRGMSKMPTKEELAEIYKHISGGKTIDVDNLTNTERTYLVAIYYISNAQEDKGERKWLKKKCF
jgi:hypothetical protein